MRLSGTAIIPAGGADATTLPPSSPAPGPMSMTQSLRRDDVHVMLDDDHRIAGSTRPSSCAISFSTSEGCRPVVGSSRT